MKRNRFGINIDEGIPLVSEPDFELLYVPCFGETAERLNSWLVEGDKPLLLGGQIGSGKSTLINKAIQEAGRLPDVTLHFDQEVLNLDAGDFWSIALAGLLETAFAKGIDLNFCKLPEELGQYQADDWPALLEGLRPRTFSMASFNAKMTLRKKVAKNATYIAKIIVEIGRLLEASVKRPLFIFATGLDKFDPLSPTFFAMQDIVVALAEFKTLYEVNAAHLFQKPGSPLYPLDRLFISVLKSDEVIEMLAKRMGVYAQPVRQELEILANWSGGNPRQALRLLSHFETARKTRKRNTGESLAVAIRETTGDFFAYSPKPSDELIKTIRRSGTIGAAMFTLPGDKDTALRALYGNWIFIREKSSDASWAATVNPLVKMVFNGATPLEDQEVKLLRDYAMIAGISPSGLGPCRIDEKERKKKEAEEPPWKFKEKSGDQLLWEFIASGVEQPIQTNLSETLDVLADALLSKDRADRAILAYKDDNLTEAARAYLFAKANSYEYQRCKHIVITGGPGMQPMTEIEAFLSEDTDIFSVEFAGKWENSQLEALDKQRDRFINHQMLWWIPFNDLKDYLPHWTQLRQLFELFVLEDELLGSISEEEVRADLAFF
ncbi:MAG: hypothetical protein COX19_09610, partial [Desulfobacterales bacterium CG23_combo_of_CG06-09_8_20_14_all_51_8]